MMMETPQYGPGEHRSRAREMILAWVRTVHRQRHVGAPAAIIVGAVGQRTLQTVCTCARPRGPGTRAGCCQSCVRHTAAPRGDGGCDDLIGAPATVQICGRRVAL